ncbi:hypothetical protein HOLleu_01098 [Holothuria leucospilota]|uniref:Uncharacterized protein n=1 Tax=Holothuria leucospilota TaxID=206669 RepID=A0A9Q1HKR1_HOLLE|nr:hypothetical protein HOLleu_01098 [Holothuria leucospilota]
MQNTGDTTCYYQKMTMVPTEENSDSDFSDASDVNDPDFVLSIKDSERDDSEQNNDDWVVSKGEDEDGDNENETGEGSNDEPFVLDSSSKQKYSYCLFCDKPQQKLPRHCRRKHADEILVAEAMAVEVNQLKRQKRRPQEVENIRVEDYKAQTTSKKAVHDEIMQSLTVPEKLSLERQTLLVARGKRGGVPILLPPNLKQSTDLLAKYNEGKEFVF